MTELTLKSIGTFESEQIEPYQAGRQPDSSGLNGRIRLHAGQNFEQALQDLVGCSHIWIIFGFHHNPNWKPLVQTPRSEKKIGVFATRAPYRPNPIGLSVVKLIDIKGLCVEVGPNDILNGSPIYDIKPYHPNHDLVADANIEWLDEASENKNSVSFSPIAEEQLDFLSDNGLNELKIFITRQLEYDPINKNKKRVDENMGYYTLSYRTWRVDFTLAENSVGILSIRSGYSEQDLDESSADYNDKYGDKTLHRSYIEFSNNS